MRRGREAQRGSEAERGHGSKMDQRPSPVPDMPRSALRGAAVAVLLPLVAILPGCATPSVASSARAHVHATLRQDVQLHRWPAGTELVVDVSTLERRDSAVVVRAFDAWLAETDVPVRVRIAGPGDRANVVFRAVDGIEAGYESMGLTTLDWEGPWLVRAEVELARSSRFGSSLSATERRRVVLHEVGHALGLGHAPRLSSIMHRSTPVTSVDDSDRAALHLLYSLSTVRAAATAPAPETE